MHQIDDILFHPVDFGPCCAVGGIGRDLGQMLGRDHPVVENGAGIGPIEGRFIDERAGPDRHEHRAIVNAMGVHGRPVRLPIGGQRLVEGRDTVVGKQGMHRHPPLSLGSQRIGQRSKGHAAHHGWHDIGDFLAVCGTDALDRGDLGARFGLIDPVRQIMDRIGCRFQFAVAGDGHAGQAFDTAG